ncbi:hypothetical protein [Rickettsiella endosymbiont of Miltochrista miniata]|uniref:hypothetical protein n=1 Tax=Rickettsiella endosymbiont of Miltochrista miniata TaxID=3066239 RepID=UPI00313D4C4F
MPHTLSIRINPDCLNQIQYEKNVSPRQNTFIESINDLHSTVKQLKSQTCFEFTQEDEKAIGRGNFYALTKSLEKKFTKQPPITFSDLQNVLKKEFRIKDEQTINFIIKSLLEPHSLPFALSLLAYSVLTDDSFWSNECTASGSEFKYTLKAKQSPSGSIIFNMRMNLKNPNLSPSSPQSSAQIQFMVNQQEQIKLLPLDMEFNFVDKKAFKEFKKELCCDFRDWIFLHKSHWLTTDLWIIPTLLGCLLGLIAMISLLALSLTPISPLLLPPLGFALGLGLSSVMHSYAHISIKKDQEKFKRPIHIFNRKPVQTTFFNSHCLNNTIESETRFVLAR